MTVIKKLSHVLILATVALGFSSGAMAVIHTQHEYYGVCSKLDGFAGLLQTTGFLQAGNCKAKPGGSLCNAGASCTVSGVKGNCKNTGMPGHAPICACVTSVSQ